jgi:type III pantothenate kinase
VSAPTFSVDVGNSSIGVVAWEGGSPRLTRHADPESATEGLYGDVAIIAVSKARLARMLIALPAEARPRVLERPPVGLGAPDLLATAGADRVAAALALLPGPAIAVDAGTAATVELVDGKGRYLGGFIAPGPAAAAAGLAEATARLPRLDGAPAPLKPGGETRAALAAGTWGLAVGGLDRLVELARAALGGDSVRVVATGGWSEAWKRDSRISSVELDDMLVHRGILRWAASG